MGLMVVITYLIIGMIVGVGGHKRYEYLTGKKGDDATILAAIFCIPFWPLYLLTFLLMKVWQAFCKYILDNLPIYVAHTSLHRFGTLGHKHADVTKSLKNFLESSGNRVTKEDVENFLKIDGWKRVASQGDLYTKFICKSSLHKQREG